MLVKSNYSIQILLLWTLPLVAVAVSCNPNDNSSPERLPAETPGSNPQTAQPADPNLDTSSGEPGRDWQKQREQMVERQLAARDIDNRRVLDAMRSVPRHEFVPVAQQPFAYGDGPLPIGHGQTISQPYIVALMTQLAQPGPEEKALDVGTGSGYQAAVLAELVHHVYSIEIVEPLAQESGKLLSRLGYDNITVKHGDGYRGWPDEAPFDVIIVAAAPDHVPQPLIDQLAPGGKLVIPVGQRAQQLMLLEKNAAGEVTRQRTVPVAFVPMTGEALDR